MVWPTAHISKKTRAQKPIPLRLRCHAGRASTAVFKLRRYDASELAERLRRDLSAPRLPSLARRESHPCWPALGRRGPNGVAKLAGGAGAAQPTVSAPGSRSGQSHRNRQRLPGRNRIRSTRLQNPDRACSGAFLRGPIPNFSVAPDQFSLLARIRSNLPSGP